MSEIIQLVVAYLIGAFPSGSLVAKASGIDIAKVGSGNVGATNVARTVGKKAGIFVLLIDIAKGLLPYMVFSILGLGISDLLPLAVVAGHCFSLPKLKGGKGVATALGILIAYSPITALIAILFFGSVFYFSKYVSLSSIVAVWSAPITLFIIFPSQIWPFSFAAVALLVTYRHKDNIQRLIESKESKFTFKR